MFAFGLTRGDAGVGGSTSGDGRRWEKDGVAAGEVREITGVVDETFLEQMILVFQDVPTGYTCRKRWWTIAPRRRGKRWWMHGSRRGNGGLVPGQ